MRIRGLPQRPLGADSEEGIRLSLAGAQPKVPVIVLDDGLMALPTNAAAPTTHIVKPEPERFPGLVDNESFCMALARACELPVAPVRKAVTVTGKPYLIVERYDRDLTVEPIRRLHQEDFCQALGIASDKKYQQEGGPTVAQSTQLLRDCTPIPGAAALLAGGGLQLDRRQLRRPRQELLTALRPRRADARTAL